MSGDDNVAALLRDAGRAATRGAFTFPSVETGRVGCRVLVHVMNNLGKAVRTMTYHGKWTDLLEYPAFQKYVASKIPKWVYSSTFYLLRKTQRPIPDEISMYIASFVDPLSATNIIGFAIHLLCDLTKKLPAHVKASVPRDHQRSRFYLKDKKHFVWTSDGEKRASSACGGQCDDSRWGCKHRLLRIDVDGSRVICHRYTTTSSRQDVARMVIDAKEALDRKHPKMWSSMFGPAAGQDVFAYIDGIPGISSCYVRVPIIEAPTRLYPTEPALQPQYTSERVFRLLARVPSSARPLEEVIKELEDWRAKVKFFETQCSTMEGVRLAVHGAMDLFDTVPARTNKKKLATCLKSLLFRSWKGPHGALRQVLQNKIDDVATVLWDMDAGAVDTWADDAMAKRDDAEFLSALHSVCAGHDEFRVDNKVTKWSYVCSKNAKGKMEWRPGASAILNEVKKRYRRLTASTNNKKVKRDIDR